MSDGVLLLGFGGPTPGCCQRRATCSQAAGCEATCFVSGVLGDHPARQARIDDVAEHYRHFGGFSPYNRLTESQRSRLSEELARRGRALKLACGYRHWTPWAIDGLRSLAEQGCERVLLLILAPHQSSVSWDWYLKYAAEAAEALGAKAPELIGVVAPFFAQPGFITGMAARVREACVGWSAERFAAARLIFTAHAVPEPVAKTSAYVQQVAESAKLVAAALGHPAHDVAFQSAPPPGGVAWTGPDIVDAVDAAARDGVRDVIVQAVGFLVDHTEVTYDLDIEAGNRAREHGLRFTRAACVHDHPAFIAALADGVEAALAVVVSA